MADIKKYKTKDGSIRYGMELPGTEKKSIRTFPTLEEAVAFAEGPASAQVPYKRSFAAAHAAIQRAAQPRRELRIALLGLAIETCARMSEIYFSEWADIDLDRRVWMIPGTYSRGGLSRTVPLTKKAQSIFREIMSSGEQGRSRVFEDLGLSAPIEY
jgi:integrase